MLLGDLFVEGLWAKASFRIKKKIYRQARRCFKDSRVECRFCGHFVFSTHPAVLALTQECEGREKKGESPETSCGKEHRRYGHVAGGSPVLLRL